MRRATIFARGAIDASLVERVPQGRRVSMGEGGRELRAERRDVVEHGADARLVESFLRPEVVVHHRQAHLGVPRDLARRAPGETVIGEGAPGALEDATLGGLGVGVDGTGHGVSPG